MNFSVCLSNYIIIGILSILLLMAGKLENSCTTLIHNYNKNESKKHAVLEKLIFTSSGGAPFFPQQFLVLFTLIFGELSINSLIL